MRILAVAAAVFAASIVVAPPASAAGCAAPKGVYTDPAPWAQRLVDPARIWPLTRGNGQIVAVVGTGVDADNAQFARGQMLPGNDLVPRSGGVADCDGRGTFAAGIIGAQPDDSTTFVGIAPGARLLPIRYTAGDSGGDPNQLAAAINQAVHAGAGVVLVAVPSTSDSPSLRTAVQQAHSAGVVVVSPASGTQAGARSYPTADPGVIAVGAADQNGVAVQTESGDYIDIAAPGADLVSTAAGAGSHSGQLWPVKDPSFAAAYVAATAVLLKSYRPSMTPDQIKARLTLTASRAPGGGRDAKLGWGTIDAYTAVSSSLPASAAGPDAPTPSATPAQFVPAATATGREQNTLVGLLALAGVAGAALAGLVTVTLRRGRARAWRTGRG